MAIKFHCSCGKRLRARDEMAARRTICPACGRPVGIPSLQPTQRGTSPEPLSPMERVTRKLRGTGPAVARAEGALLEENLPRPASPPGSAAALESLPLDTEILFKPPREKRLRHRPLALKGWSHLFLFPFRAAPLAFILALALTAITGAAVHLGPQVADPHSPTPTSALLGPQLAELWAGTSWLGLLCRLAALPVLVYGCAFLQCILSSAVAGQAGQVSWPRGNLLFVFKSTIAWIVCFLAGPVVPATAAFLFWYEGGDPDLVDWLILAELSLVAVAHWIFSILAVSQRGRMLDANPVRVVQLIHQQGTKTAAIVLAGSLLAMGDGLLILNALDLLHSSPGTGWLLLIGGWTGAMLLAAFLLRWLGLRCYFQRTAQTEPPG
jgi:hypothetical protein